MKHGERFTICHEGECLVLFLYTRTRFQRDGWGLRLRTEKVKKKGACRLLHRGTGIIVPPPLDIFILYIQYIYIFLKQEEKKKKNKKKTGGGKKIVKSTGGRCVTF